MTLERRIADALYWQPGVDLDRVHVSIAEGGALTLQGVVHTYADKCAVEEALLHVRGVSEVRNLLEVQLTIGDYRTDATLQIVLRDLIGCLARMPAELPRVSVVDGWVKLEGTVQYAFQKQLVENAIREVAGVRGITNEIQLAPYGVRQPRLQPPHSIRSTS